MMVSRGHGFSFAKYVEILKTIAGNHAIAKVFTGFSGMTAQQTFYSVASIGFYLMSLYQNTQICIKFYTNMFKIHDKLFQIRDFAKYVGGEMTAFLKQTTSLASYDKFNASVRVQQEVITKIHDTISEIPPCEVSYVKLMDMGKVLKWFYTMHVDEEFHDAMLFSLGFMGYIRNIQGVQENLRNCKMNYGMILDKTRVLAESVEIDAKKSKKERKREKKEKKEREQKGDTMNVMGVYHPSTDLPPMNPVKNDVMLKKDCIITGPNASGKTTMLKSLFLSILLTQQYGCGFYDSCSFVPYTHLHCYLNIPDTSGRDSLFQSESRKCKDILDSIRRDGASSRHFCLFDELYSGTNPVEAVKCGYAYLCHLSETENIHYVLTTHYVELCEKLKASNGLLTYRMKVTVPAETSEPFEYMYKMEEGVNEVDGGVEVLRQMQYPDAILKKISL